MNKQLLGDRLDEDCIYLCGQSLGLQPKEAQSNVLRVLDNWSQYTVHTHTHGYLPAAFCDLPPKRPMATLAGCSENEIAIMNGLSVNLQILFSTFYRPTATRNKILIEDQAFSSDMVGLLFRALESGLRTFTPKAPAKPFSDLFQYVVQSQIRLHNLQPDECLITILPREVSACQQQPSRIKILNSNRENVQGRTLHTRRGSDESDR